MSVTLSRSMKASAEAALALLADFSRLQEYNPGVHTRGARAGVARAGDEFLLFVKAGPGKLKINCTVTSIDERHLALECRAIVNAREVRSATPSGDGCVVGWDVTYQVPWWLGGTISDRLLFSPLARRNIETELDGVQRILESR